MIEFTRKIGRNRGKPRLWIEGKHLTDAGFRNGDKWSFTAVKGGAVIQRDDEGGRKIAGKPDRPIIDICGSSLGDEIGQAESVTLRYHLGSGVMFVFVNQAEMPLAA